MKEYYFHILGTPSDADFTVYPTQVINGKKFLLDYTLNLIGSNATTEGTTFTADQFVEVRLYGFSSTAHTYDTSFGGAANFIVLGYVTAIQGSGNTNTRFPSSPQFAPSHPTVVQNVSQGPWNFVFWDLSTGANLFTNRIQNSSAFLRLRCIDETPRNLTRSTRALGSAKTYQLRSTDRVTNVIANQAVQSFDLKETPLDSGLFRITFTFAGTALNTGVNYQASLWVFGISCTNYQTLLSTTGGLITGGQSRTSGFGDTVTNGLCVGSFQAIGQPGPDLGITPRGGTWMFGAGLQRSAGLFDNGFSIIANRLPTRITFMSLNNNTGVFLAINFGFLANIKVTPYDADSDYEAFGDDYDNFYSFNN